MKRASITVGAFMLFTWMLQVLLFMPGPLVHLLLVGGAILLIGGLVAG